MTDSLSRALSAAAVHNAKPKEKPYKLADGGGLFLQVQPSGAKLWRYKFRLHGKEGLFSIGVYPKVSLKQARDAHNEARAQVSEGKDPVAHRKADRAEKARLALQKAKGLFSTVLADWKALRGKQLAPATIQQQNREITKYVEPKLASKPINEIVRLELTELIKSISKTAPEVARNIRTYLDSIVSVRPPPSSLKRSGR